MQAVPDGGERDRVRFPPCGARRKVGSLLARWEAGPVPLPPFAPRRVDGSAQRESRLEVSGLICPNCGSVLDEGARHCDGCGARVSEAPSKARGKGKMRSPTAHFVSDIVVAAVSFVVIVAAAVRWLVATVSTFPL